MEDGRRSPSYLLGFPDWSKTISSDPDHFGLIFRRFNDSASRNLLYLEGRVAALRKAQEELDQQDYSIVTRTTDVLSKIPSEGEWKDPKKKCVHPLWVNYKQAATSWEWFATSSLPATNEGLNMTYTAQQLDIPTWLLLDFTRQRNNNLFDYLVTNHQVYALLLDRRAVVDGTRMLQIFGDFLKLDERDDSNIVDQLSQQPNWKAKKTMIIDKWYETRGKNQEPSMEPRLHHGIRLWEEYVEDQAEWKNSVQKSAYNREQLQERESRSDAISNIWGVLHAKDPSDIPKSLQGQSIYKFSSVAQDMARRVELATCLKNAIREYQEALILHHKVLNLANPAGRTRAAMKKAYEPTIEHEDLVEGEFDSSSSMSRIFEDESDLLTLHIRAGEDRLSRWLARRTWLGCFLRWVFGDKTDEYRRLIIEPEKRIDAIVISFNMVAAIGFLIAAVWALWAIHDFITKLAAMTGFVVAFSLWVGLFTKAAKMEVFAATAAYAAVLVVYVGRG
ncbi:hypothetical protein F5B22DRAFT_592468 [Xylaria bambusicola]|uniref:uncharacterized protein n=1 Tax=Xylaria bambusicola TaxID=326684 RepID=UPI00200755C7|nr:uncharacterized protein F5B22DRAFT_592468 [Xylaria bambusicola]KAI0523910.1 hypothetical protein F5B22DRAFT_592468 [Xylaria bambusicola]